MKSLSKIAMLIVLLAILTVSISFMATPPIIIINGSIVRFNDDLGYPYIDKNGRTMVPLKASAEAAGAMIGWDSKTRTAIIVTKDVRVEVPIGTNVLYVNGVRITNDTESVINGGRTYLPIKAVLEAVGFSVRWDDASRSVLASVDNFFVARGVESYNGTNLSEAVYGISKLGFKKTNDSIIYKDRTYKIIKVDGGDLNGSRMANAAVDIGYADREYWGLTNENGQLVYVLADKVILQNASSEPVLPSGRYYPDEAKVPGVERADLDEGHVIADSLGGVSNAYNITPQNSVLNQNGNQAYMEKWIRDAGGCTEFLAVITYPNSSTQIPSKYRYSYVLKGNAIVDEFDNISPECEETHVNNSSSALGTIEIVMLDKKAEYIVLKNTTSSIIDLTGWKIRSVKGDQWFTFPAFSLDSEKEVKIGDFGQNNDLTFHWLDGKGTWNNGESDPAELYDSTGKLIDRYEN